MLGAGALASALQTGLRQGGRARSAHRPGRDGGVAMKTKEKIVMSTRNDGHIRRPRLDAPCPVIDLDGCAALISPVGEQWGGSRIGSRVGLFDTLKDAKAEED